LGKTVRELLANIDSEEISEWQAYDARWPLPDAWQIGARICRVVMCASGNYKQVPQESAFIPAVKRPEQSADQMVAEMKKLMLPPTVDQG
jgi:hypothetical protein